MNFLVIAMNLILDIVYVVCVTFASVHFNKPSILLWYLLVLVTGYSIKSKEKNITNEGERRDK